MLTKNEAKDLKNALSELLEDLHIGESHIHVNNDSYSKELTVMLYDSDSDPKDYNLSKLVLRLSTKDGKFVDNN